MINKVIKNRYFILIVGLAIIYFSKSSKSIWYDILDYIENCSLEISFLDIYLYSFLWIEVWIFRLIAVCLNITNTRERKEYSVVWTVFSILLPGISLIIQSLIFRNTNHQIKRKIIVFISIFLFLIGVVLILGKVKCSMTQTERLSYCENFEVKNLDSLKIGLIDSMAQKIDSVETKYFVKVDSKDTLIRVENLDYVPVNMTGTLSIQFNAQNQILYVRDSYGNIEINSYFDSIGNIYLKRILIFQYNIDCADKAIELVSEYYENKNLLKRDYKIIDNNGIMIDATKCKFNERGVVKAYSDVNEFINTYNINGN